MEATKVYGEAAAILENVFGEDASVYEDYSGRGMYGGTTPGISTSASGVQVGIAIALAYRELAGDEFDEYELQELALGRSDSLGVGVIYY